jgi:hypothetical protein
MTETFYFVFVNGQRVSIDIRNLNSSQSYTLNRAAYELIVKRLREIYSWGIYNDVAIN